MNYVTYFDYNLRFQFAGATNETMLFVGIGARGSFTTYSSFSFQTVRLWETGDQFRATLYAVGTLVLCLDSVEMVENQCRR